MTKGAFTSYFDVAQLVLYMFWIFFFGLMYWLARENRREGYPLESNRGTHDGWMALPPAKTYKMADGRTMTVPKVEPPRPLNAQPLHGHGGTPYEPTGDPMLAGVGPGAWTARHDGPECDGEGHPKIRPLALCDGYDVSPRDPDPRGMTVFDGRGEPAGRVRDLWIDVPECQFRYLEIEVPLQGGGTRLVLCPMVFASVKRDSVHVPALMAAHFPGVPAIKGADTITLHEEERITAYYGGGTLYADPRRVEAVL